MDNNPTESLDTDFVENVALGALQHLASTQEELSRFFALTGLDPAQMRDQADSKQLYVAILEYYLNHEPSLLALAASLRHDPSVIVKVHENLAGTNHFLQSGEY